MSARLAPAGGGCQRVSITRTAWATSARLNRAHADRRDDRLGGQPRRIARMPWPAIRGWLVLP